MTRVIQEYIPITKEMIVEPHAHWVKIYVDYPHYECMDAMAMCSACKRANGMYAYRYVIESMKECPYCHAQMDEVTE